MKRFRFFLLFLFIWTICWSSMGQENYFQQWPQFRGAFASGILDSMNLPDNWDIETGENIKWKLDIPGLGHSCPVIWNEKLFITTAISGSGDDGLKAGLYGDIDDVDDDSEHMFMVYCVDKNTGGILWTKMAHKGIPKTKRHTKSSHANPTPATNGEYVLAFFGSDGLYCYTMDGELVWSKDFGRMNAGPHNAPDSEWGFASSPIIHEEKVFIQCDFLGDCFLGCYNLKTGEEIWKTPRKEISTWSTPNFYQKDEHRQIVVNGYEHMGAYDFDTGKEIWRMSGGGDAPVPTPFFAHDLIYIHNSHGRKSPIYAIRPEAKGDITLAKDSISSEYVAWSINRGAAYMPTNLVYGDYLYNMRMNGSFSCFNAVSGELIYKEKIEDVMGITSSGVASDGKLFYSTESGDVHVIKAGPEFELTATNNLGDVIMATPAISDNALFFRTQHHLIAVEKQKENN